MLYELKDGKGSLINFDYSDGLYTVPKELDNGYLAIGKKRVDFHVTSSRKWGEELAMLECNENPPATVPAQREAVGPVKKSTPVMIALIAIVAMIGIANVSSLFSGKKRSAPASALPMRPATANPQQVSSFQSQQQIQARNDAADQQRQQELAAAMQQLQQAEAVPGPEAKGAPNMTAAQRDAIYGDSPNAPKQTSDRSQADAEAKQKVLEREKLHQDALNSDTVAIDFSHVSSAAPGISPTAAGLSEREEGPSKTSGETPALDAPDMRDG